MKSVLIIGAGFCGAVIAARLLRQRSDGSVRIYLVNGSGRIARGMAYGTQSPHHVLNVPAGNMSAFDEDPEHFLEYVRKFEPDVTPGSFVSRRLYGDYLEWLLNEAELAAPQHIELHRLYCQVDRIALGSEGQACHVTLDSGKILEVDKVVLALGHFPASRPRLADTSFYDTPRYLHDPWDHARLDAIPARAPVVLLGTGLTTIDVAMTLLSRNPERKITAVSRRGLLPQHHRRAAGKLLDGLDAQSIWGTATTVREQLRALRKFCQTLAEQGRDWREALAILRHVTADVWLAYPEKERRRFLRHVQPYWDTHRHRLAPQVAERFSEALATGAVRTLASRIVNIEDNDDAVLVTLRPRGTDEMQVLRTDYVINCTGPCADPRESNSGLVKQLLSDGLLRADALGLGIDVAPDCSVVMSNGEASHKLFYIGPWLKANYWEATAVPDLRTLAGGLASRIMSE